MFCSAIPLSLSGAAPEESWPQFRGPSGDGQLKEPTFPLQWDEATNIAWKVPFQEPVGHSRLSLTEGFLSRQPSLKIRTNPKRCRRDRAILARCLGIPNPRKRFIAGKSSVWIRRRDRSCGKKLRPNNGLEFLFTHPTPTPRKPPQQTASTFSRTSPRSEKWSVSISMEIWSGKSMLASSIANGMGTGSSPIALDGKLILQSDNEDKSFLLALDANSGKETWRVDRGKGTSWSSPYLWRNKDRTELIACGSNKVESYDPTSGMLLWKSGSIKSGFSATPVGNAELLFVGNSPPLSTSPLLAVKAGASGDITLAKGAKSSEWTPWSRLKSGPGLSSPIVVGDLLYIATDSFLNCYDTKSGERLYRERLPESQHIVACPWVGGDKLFFLEEDGRTYVVKAGPVFEIVGINKLEETFWASPAISGNQLLLRGVDKLYAIRSIKQ